jgi:hypothetical protein
MPSLGFSIEKNTVSRSPAELRAIRRQVEKQANISGLVVGVVGFGLILLAAFAYQDQARLFVQRLIG